eukprot:Phypoly_transcript_08108.p1 GENE.Phypoly_transcript_08108~~Phypoly_transcript_08108.p1  ORF type:complete len:472 (+),score=54.03 Phypoly_transcript_08108:50-1465(+)
MFSTKQGKVFLVLLLSQTLSSFGSSLTSFALGVFIFQKSNSVTQYALCTFFASVPNILISPIAGTVADKYDKKKIMIFADLACLAVTAWIAYLSYIDVLDFWHIYIACSLDSLFGAFQGPAFSSSISSLVAKKDYARASGMVDMGMGLSQLISPSFSGVLVTWWGLKSVMLVDLVTCALAVSSVLFVDIPPKSKEKEKTKNPWREEVLLGWNYIKKSPPLIGLTLVYAIDNFTGCFIMELIPPLSLIISSAETFGYMSSTVGIGFLIGSICVSVWGCPKPYGKTIFAMLAIQGAIMTTGRMEPTVEIITITGFIYMFLTPFISGCSDAIWRSKIPQSLQGRVFAITKTIVTASTPLAALAAGPLTDFLSELLSSPTGIGFWLNKIVVEGKGPGPRLLFFGLGCNLLVTSLVIYFYPKFHLRDLDTCLPDVVQDESENSEKSDNSANPRKSRNSSAAKSGHNSKKSAKTKNK